METKWETALSSQYPFMQRTGGQTAYHKWGLEMGKGWFQLLWDMCAEITEVYQAADKPVDIVVDQVKEKFGKLRFYWHPAGQEIAIHAIDHIGGGASLRFQPNDSEIHQKVGEIVSRYEELSAHVCEVCGAPGCLRSDLRWVRTLCEDHYQRMMRHTERT